MALPGVHRSDVATRLLDSGGLIVGSSTLNKNMLPRMADVLNYIRGLQPKGLIGGVFGSYGWSGETIGQLQAELAAIGADLVGEPGLDEVRPGRSKRSRSASSWARPSAKQSVRSNTNSRPSVRGTAGRTGGGRGKGGF